MPTFVIGENKLIGAQEYRSLTKTLPTAPRRRSSSDGRRSASASAAARRAFALAPDNVRLAVVETGWAGIDTEAATVARESREAYTPPNPSSTVFGFASSVFHVVPSTTNL